MKRQLPAGIGLWAAVLVGLHGCGVSFGPYPVPPPLVEITAVPSTQTAGGMGGSGRQTTGSSLTDQQLQDLLNQLSGGQ